MTTHNTPDSKQDDLFLRWWKSQSLDGEPERSRLIARVAFKAGVLAAASSSAPAEPPPSHALVQLLNAALLHPESAEGNIRQVIETLNTAYDENKRLRDHIADLNHDLEAAIKECNEQHG